MFQSSFSRHGDKMLEKTLVIFLLALGTISGQGRRFFGGGSYYGPGYNYYSSYGPSTYSYANTGRYGYTRPTLTSYFQDGFVDERGILPEWFEVDDRDDCSNVPETVNTGRPRDLCGDNDLGQRFCICLKRGGSYPGRYEPVCGECRDPCALRFVPDTYPRRRDDDDDDDDDNNNNRRDDDNDRRRDQGRRFDDDDDGGRRTDDDY